MGRKHCSSPGQDLACILAWSSLKSSSLVAAPVLRGSPRRFLGWGKEGNCYLTDGAVHITHVHASIAIIPQTQSFCYTSFLRYGSLTEQCHELLYKTDPAGKGEKDGEGSCCPGHDAGQPRAPLTKGSQCSFNLNAGLYRQNKISCRGLLTRSPWLLHVLIQEFTNCIVMG